MNKNKFSKEVNDPQKYCDITQHTLLNKRVCNKTLLYQ